MIKLIVTDMDGTLLNEKEELNKEFLNVFKELRNKDILFAVASGRQRKNLELKFNDIKDDLIMLFENGSCGSLNGTNIYRSELDKTIVHKLIDIGRKNSHNMLLCTEDMTYIENVNEEFILELRKYYENITFVNDLKEIDKPVVKFTIFDPKGAKENSFKIYNELVGKKVKVSISTIKWLHIINKEVSKGFGVQALQNHFNISPEETMVFGDGNNDLEMITSAKYSYAMENAIEELKELAFGIAPSNNNNGVLEIIKKEVLTEKPVIENIAESETIKESIPMEETTIENSETKVVEKEIIEEAPIAKKTKAPAKKKVEKKVTTEKKVVVSEEPSNDDFDDFDDFDLFEEKHPFDDESLEEKLLAILG